MYFENSLPIDGTYKGIKPNTNGYTFDNRFIVTLDKENNIFHINDSPNYVQIYNNAISNVSCIVGKNGSGKTTFMELLITNIAWGITEKQPSLMKSIYYEINADGTYKFFLHQYINWNENYKIHYNGNEVFINKNGYNSPPHPVYGSNFSSQIPEETKFIFHSLSPFDKIFYSISLPFKKNPKRISPFIDQMKYIGNQNIFVGDPKHEIQTLTNLITLFSNEYFSKPFNDSLGYTFSRIEIDLEHKKRTVDINTKIYIDEIINKVSTFQNIEKYPELVAFKNIDKKKQEEFLSIFFAKDLSKSTAEEFLRFIIIDSFTLIELTTNITYFNNFLKLISFSSIIDSNGNINGQRVRQNILSIQKFPDYIFIKDSKFLNEFIQKKDELETILKLSNLPIEQISKINNLPAAIQLIRRLKNKDYLEFKLYLLKKDEEINYFYLSSGEKTMISYFANLMSSILDFPSHDNKTFIILIDEVELHLHPEWQRNFIDYMNKFFRENNLNMKYQFIIATHSPFILSDIVEEQIIFINQDEKKSNEHNTFGANIYDIFEKGFFLENSIGKCSESYIHELSNTIYLFKALEHIVEHQDYFLIRNYLQKHYEIDSNSKKSIDEQKKEADEVLFRNILNELKNKDLVLLKNKISSTSIEKYVIQDTSVKLDEQMNKYINIIGEPTIKIHLQEIYEDIKKFEIDAN
jgi:energy-coupling factor transporter ATP-binding protein EcfA2